jgi:hypothetical protein
VVGDDGKNAEKYRETQRLLQKGASVFPGAFVFSDKSFCAQRKVAQFLYSEKLVSQK